ncbi:TetR/AcrR family transcriptional regulator [Pedobacter miscanthi]|uniref:TetR/AcrR family transcriptional regulator n=1 Tax=Pedobacter miscanthi TaxID=2259170 RepID=A0A366L1U8_9SPHI|nr:TetR/AcrR family transcriptional regulator [Pedobacter miscanthi]RBQ07858.1 TetR/AcrR family transcriptional regulator [Pedobacter miscanthi]
MKKSALRERIILTASLLFYKQGYSNTGINQIIEEADIAKSSLYQYFRSKEDLLIAYLSETGESTIQALTAAAQEHSLPESKILGIFEYLEELMHRKDFYGCHFLNMVYELPHDAERIRKEVTHQKDQLRILFREILDPVGKADVANEVYTLFEGALVGHKIYNENWPITAAKNVIRKLL